MRRLLFASLLLLTACRQNADEVSNQSSEAPGAGPDTTPAAFAGSGRDRFCLGGADGPAGFITYGDGDANCSVTGTVTRSGNRLTISPEGDSTCRIEATLAGDRLTLGEVAPACAYYCGPSASFAGKQFTRTPTPLPVTDLAGDLLC